MSFQLDLENKKYTVVFDPKNGGVRIDRHGEPWISPSEMVGNNAWFAAAARIQELEEQVAKLREQQASAPEKSTFSNDRPMMIDDEGLAEVVSYLIQCGGRDFDWNQVATVEDIEQHTGIELCYAGYAIIARAIDSRGASLSADFLTVHRTVYGEDYEFATDWSANAEVFDQGEAGEKWKVTNPRAITPAQGTAAEPIVPRFSRPRG